jgi:hypothetical protein
MSIRAVFVLQVTWETFACRLWHRGFTVRTRLGAFFSCSSVGTAWKCSAVVRRWFERNDDRASAFAISYCSDRGFDED